MRVFGNVDLARALGERRAPLAHQVLPNPKGVDSVYFRAPKLVRLIGSLAAHPATSYFSAESSSTCCQYCTSDAA